ncbi:hypothetical protein GJ496_010027 [Pomphorhynchus laevis]|nr:hypothetical protein GJ496_010027 [Pomphorhynchus laevis]
MKIRHASQYSETNRDILTTVEDILASLLADISVDDDPSVNYRLKKRSVLNPTVESNPDTEWGNLNSPIGCKSENLAGGMSQIRIFTFPLQRGKKTSTCGSGRSRHHSKDRRSISPRNRSRHAHRYHRYREGISAADDKWHGSPLSSYRSRHYRRSIRYHSPASSHGIRRIKSSDDSDVTRRHTSKRRYRDSRSPSTNRASSSKHKRRSRSMKSRS